LRTGQLFRDAAAELQIHDGRLFGMMEAIPLTGKYARCFSLNAGGVQVSTSAISPASGELATETQISSVRKAHIRTPVGKWDTR
jgi:hypothetical protein